VCVSRCRTVTPVPPLRVRHSPTPAIRSILVQIQRHEVALRQFRPSVVATPPSSATRIRRRRHRRRRLSRNSISRMHTETFRDGPQPVAPGTFHNRFSITSYGCTSRRCTSIGCTSSDSQIYPKARFQIPESSPVIPGTGISPNIALPPKSARHR